MIMDVKELLNKIGNSSYSYKNNKTPTLQELGINEQKIRLVDKWSREMSTYGILGLYIPELRNVNKELTAIAIGDLHGNRFVVGNGSAIKASAQSVIKPFLYLYALEKGVPSEKIANSKESDRAYTNYTMACSLGMNVSDTLNASLVLASGGIGTHNKKKLANLNNVVRVLSAMNTFGLYEQSGKIALLVSGARANTSKSGVGGLIININPGVGAFVTYSPLLNSEGNSVYGLYAMILLNNLLALPGGMRLDAGELNKALDDYTKEESEKVHRKIISLVKQGENSSVFRINPKLLKSIKKK